MDSERSLRWFSLSYQLNDPAKAMTRFDMWVDELSHRFKIKRPNMIIIGVGLPTYNM